jgi:hypothetical protein
MMMSQQSFYCSELSRGYAEKTFGTASVGDLWLLIEYPFPWGTKAIQDSDLSPIVKAHLMGFVKTTPRSRLLFIKRDRKPKDGLAVFVVRCREHKPSITRLRINDYEQLLDIDLARSAASAPSIDAGDSDRPLYLVCTHGKRDKCCAKFGYPLYKSLSSLSPSVWQCSHVGGDRFAANLVCFPHGLFYAHVTEESGRLCLEEYEAGRLVLDKYRGRACYQYPVQAAEYFIRTEGRLKGLDELRHLGCERTAERQWRVRFASAGGETIHEARVKSIRSEFQSYNTCHSAEERSVIQYLLDDYLATSVSSGQTVSEIS